MIVTSLGGEPERCMVRRHCATAPFGQTIRISVSGMSASASQVANVLPSRAETRDDLLYEPPGSPRLPRSDAVAERRCRRWSRWGGPHCLWLAFQDPLSICLTRHIGAVGIANQKMLADPVLIPTAAPRHCPESWQIRTGGAGWFADPIPSDFRNGGHLPALEVETGSLEITVHSTGLSGSSTL